MGQHQFNLRLDDETLGLLKALAEATERSQAGEIRHLVKAEAARLGLVAGHGEPIGGQDEHGES